MVNNMANDMSESKKIELLSFGLKQGLIEYVKPSNRQSGYYRKKPDRSHPTLAQIQNRLKFGEIAFNTFGTKGWVQEKGQLLSQAAVAVKKEMPKKKLPGLTKEQKVDKIVQIITEQLL